MLREVGKRDVVALEEFLGEHCRVMPRTMLRYAIERFSDEKRQKYLDG
ncbi:MAG: DNA alkylation repair protein [Pirellulaceae bacterium]